MPGSQPDDLSRLLTTPLIAFGVLAAALVWGFEHVGSRTAAVLIALVAIAAGAVVARRLHAQLGLLSAHYETLLETAAEQSGRAEAALRVKDEFLSTLSHELRTPLNSVLGWSRLLSTGKLNAEQTAHALTALDRAGWAQSRLIEDLLDVSRMAEGTLKVSPRRTVVEPIVESAISSLRAAADARQIVIHTELDPEVGPICVDPDRMHQVVWHLLSNAIKFTPDGGHVSVRMTSQGRNMLLTVRDTGVGFSMATADQLFEPFHRGDTGATRRYGGLGLGLGIVRHVVEQHGGSVVAQSEGPGQGAEFAVRLPMPVSDAYVEDPAPPIEPAPLLRGLSILVVDDSPEDREFVRASLEQYGAVVRTAGSVREARERFRSEPPDVLVSDLVLPGEDGLQLIREIRAMDEHLGRLTPAAALTALARSEDRRQALSAGYQMHVSKPIDPFELASTIERLAALRESDRHHG